MSTGNLKKAEHFSDRLRAARLRHGLSQEDLADKLKVSHGAVGNWETGPTIPRPQMLRKIEGLLGVPIETLLQGRPAAHSMTVPESPAAPRLTPARSASQYAWMETATLEKILADLAARLPQSAASDRPELLATLTAVIAELTTRDSTPPAPAGRSTPRTKEPPALTEAQKIAQSAGEKYDRRPPRPPK
jgi:transcriptional regulator with XRE-family HTH domain